MKNLVTGGAGFIGAHLCRALWKAGEEVAALDNLYCGSEENIQDLIGKERFSFINADVRDLPDIAVDRIWHLACPASPVMYQKDFVYTHESLILGAMNVMKLAVKNHCRVLLASTSEVYGEPLTHPQTEEYRGNVNPIGIRACYDEGKRVSETVFFDYHRQYGVDIAVARIFNTYGPGMMENDGRVVSNFITQALKGEDLTIYGDGTQTRSFCYVDDTVGALIALMRCEGFTGPCNIGNPKEYSILDIAKIVLEQTGSLSKLVFRDLPKDDPTRRRPDISLAKEKLNYVPRVDLEEGIRRTAAYFRERC